jgi:hypothetical protein
MTLKTILLLIVVAIVTAVVVTLVQTVILGRSHVAVTGGIVGAIVVVSALSASRKRVS